MDEITDSTTLTLKKEELNEDLKKRFYDRLTELIDNKGTKSR